MMEELRTLRENAESGAFMYESSGKRMNKNGENVTVQLAELLRENRSF